ncbi:MAG: glycoside hydrolase family 9 protein, partial [Verrucomicrobiota bacterium]
MKIKITGIRWFFLLLLLTRWSAALLAQSLATDNNNSLKLATPGSCELKILSSTLLELALITTKEPDPAEVMEWNFVDSEGNLNLPEASEFQVTVNDHPVPAQVISFKRRPIYAPLVIRDLRIANHIYLELSEPVIDGETVRVANVSENLWTPAKHFEAIKDSFRWSPVIHVNEVGYAPNLPKKAMIGFFLGSTGEMPVSLLKQFSIVDTTTREVVFQSALTAREDVGYLYAPLPYQKVLEADFTEFQNPGEYFLQIPDLGVSFPFRIGDGVLSTFARTYGLGLYHQRCGTANNAPFTRHTHAACHILPVEVPTLFSSTVNEILAEDTADFSDNPRHTAPQLKSVDDSLYPFVNTDPIDVSGGHHDAGDYSKYTINSAQLIHALIFAVDALPGVSELDNLGLPESGDGISDVLQMAKWEADFLAKLQDADGGFYFLVYPRD